MKMLADDCKASLMILDLVLKQLYVSDDIQNPSLNSM